MPKNPELQNALARWRVINDRLKDFTMLGDILETAAQIDGTITNLEAKRDGLVKAIDVLEVQKLAAKGDFEALKIQLGEHRQAQRQEVERLRSERVAEISQKELELVNIHERIRDAQITLAAIQRDQAAAERQLSELRQKLNQSYQEALHSIGGPP